VFVDEGILPFMKGFSGKSWKSLREGKLVKDLRTYFSNSEKTNQLKFRILCI
jgi:hypothetical protein